MYLPALYSSCSYYDHGSIASGGSAASHLVVMYRSTVCVQDRCIARSVAQHRRNCRHAALLATTAFSQHLRFRHTPTDWTGPVSTDWFLGANWIRGRPTQTSDAPSTL